MVGKSGLEELYEKKLRGQQGSKIYVTKNDVDGETTEKVIAEKPVKNGETVQLTIDVNVQEKIYNSYDGEAGTAAAINPKTGETLALVSSPAYDPNLMSYGISQDQWKEMADNPKQPMLNRFSSTYASGSVIKPITAAIGLKNGTIKPDEGLTINGLEWSNGKGWGDYKVHRVSGTNSPVDLNDALNRSDNIYFAMQAVKMGSDKFVKGLHHFGLGEKFPFEYPIKKSQISNNGQLDNEVLLANTSYGQGEAQFSALHLATAYTTFLNNGDMLKPLLLASDKKKQVWKKGLLTKEQAEEIQKDLRDVVVKGTGTKAKRKDFPISGKTGTAELKASKEDKSGDENGWFIGYPTKKTRYCHCYDARKDPKSRQQYCCEKSS
ncbi:penicillin-binding protein 2 [Virgibacillus halophilus]|uniref:Penicillin-binding protein 2 n=1 Tax=Tigheibacillus halophilus TaxID=361280 RepID=A0ABU5C2X5_9BACI|nr:penicillin-binding protein 2 [Virgibacillus halophilus]